MGLFGALLALAALLIAAGSAQAGTYTVIQCETTLSYEAPGAVYAESGATFSHPANCSPSPRPGLQIMPPAASLGNFGRWQLAAPPGLVFTQINYNLEGRAINGWAPATSVTTTGGTDIPLTPTLDGVAHPLASGSGSFRSVQLSLPCASATCASAGRTVTSTNPTAGAPTYNSATIDFPNQITAMSCPTTTLCVAVDDAGRALVSTNPTAGSPTWTPTLIDTGKALSGVSCVTNPTTLCVATDRAGNGITSVDPINGTWNPPASIDGVNRITGVSCVSPTLCGAVDAVGRAVFSTTPTVALSWTGGAVNGAATPVLTGLSCASTTLCVAVDAAGRAYTTVAPGPTPAFTNGTIDAANALSGISCPTNALCVASDRAGNVVSSTTPSTGAASYTVKNIDGTTPLTGISCDSGATFCVAVDSSGNALESNNPSNASPTYTPAVADGPLSGVSCATSGLCVAFSTDAYVAGHEFSFTVNDVSAPALAVSGALLSGGTKAGSQGLQVDATDQGSGISRLTVSANGSSVAAVNPQCPGSSLVGPNFLFSPCPGTVNQGFSINTANAPFQNGTNTVQVCASDFAASGASNQTCQSAQVTTKNGCHASVISGGTKVSGKFTANHKTKITRKGKKGAKVRGKLLDGSGQALGSAALCAKETAPKTSKKGGKAKKAKTTKTLIFTNSSGSYSYNVKGGKSRDITISYSDGKDKAAAKLQFRRRK